MSGFDGGFTLGFGYTPAAWFSGKPPVKPLPREWSTSEGDRNRGSFRPSVYPRLFQRAICNDDGSPIMAEPREILDELRSLRQGLEA